MFHFFVMLQTAATPTLQSHSSHRTNPDKNKYLTPELTRITPMWHLKSEMYSFNMLLKSFSVVSQFYCSDHIIHIKTGIVLDSCSDNSSMHSTFFVSSHDMHSLPGFWVAGVTRLFCWLVKTPRVQATYSIPMNDASCKVVILCMFAS